LYGRGVTRLRLLAGGFKAWQDRAYPVERREPPEAAGAKGIG
jgi:3-mercaptopyruvate sulfurtransferase SseA